jgi:succinate-acetate transporter protein
MAVSALAVLIEPLPAAGRPPGMSAPRSEIFLRPLGSPLPLGLAGLAVASLVVSGLDLGWVAATSGHDVGLMLLVAGVPLQLIGCAFALPARDAAAATSMGVLSISWMAMGLTRLLSPPGSVSHPLGLVLLATGGILACSAAGQAAGKPLAGLTLGCAAARLILSGLHELTGSGGLQTASGIVGLAVVATAGYMVVALGLEAAQDRAVLPVGRRGRAQRRPADRDGGPADGALREPGVRPQL